MGWTVAIALAALVIGYLQGRHDQWRTDYDEIRTGYAIYKGIVYRVEAVKEKAGD